MIASSSHRADVFSTEAILITAAGVLALVTSIFVFSMWKAKQTKPGNQRYYINTSHLIYYEGNVKLNCSIEMPIFNINWNFIIIFQKCRK